MKLNDNALFGLLVVCITAYAFYSYEPTLKSVCKNGYAYVQQGDTFKQTFGADQKPVSCK